MILFLQIPLSEARLTDCTLQVIDFELQAFEAEVNSTLTVTKREQAIDHCRANMRADFQ
jgi:hypothetical protein